MFLIKWCRRRLFESRWHWILFHLWRKVSRSSYAPSTILDIDNIQDENFIAKHDAPGLLSMVRVRMPFVGDFADFHKGELGTKH
jgi:hypothetical protein